MSKFRSRETGCERFCLMKLLAPLPLYYYHHHHHYHYHYHPATGNTFFPYKFLSYNFKSRYKGTVFPLDPIKAYEGLDIIAPRFINFGRFISEEKNPPAACGTGCCEGYRARLDYRNLLLLPGIQTKFFLR